MEAKIPHIPFLRDRYAGDTVAATRDNSGIDGVVQCLISLREDGKCSRVGRYEEAEAYDG